MLDHVSLGVSDLARSRRFYDAALRPLGLVRIVNFEGRGADYGAAPGSLGVEFTITVEAIAAPSMGMHICFRAPNREAVREFHRLALASGGRDHGGPGCAPTITRATTGPSYWIRTAIESRPSAMRRTHHKRCESYRRLALNLSSAAEPGHSSFSPSELSGASTVLR